MCALHIHTFKCQLPSFYEPTFQISTKAFVFSVVVVVIVVVVVAAAVAVVAVYVCFCVCTCFVSTQDRLAPRVLLFTVFEFL
jgi:cytochrome c oxidase assembly protein Cox11